MPGPIYDYLKQDHVRLDELLRQSTACPDEIDRSSYTAFRAGLLRHIGIEEKILIPAAKRANGGVPLSIATQIRRDHAALAALLVPTPTLEIMNAIREILDRHNLLEEQDGGLYTACETLLASELNALAGELRGAPAVPVAPHFDGPRVQAHIESLLKKTNPSSSSAENTGPLSRTVAHVTRKP